MNAANFGERNYGARWYGRWPAEVIYIILAKDKICWYNHAFITVTFHLPGDENRVPAQTAGGVALAAGLTQRPPAHCRHYAFPALLRLR